jgi:cytochrome c oxidase assembly factor CtaG
VKLLVSAHLGGPTLAPLQLAPLALVAILYALRARTLAREGRPPPAWRQWSFHGGLALIAVTLISPLAHVSDELLAAHMAEHLLIADVAALFVVLGLTGPLVAPVLRVRALGALRVLSHPAVAFPLWALDLYLWHLPGPYQAAIHHAGVHALEHAMFVGLGINMWMGLLGPLPTPEWFHNFARLVYVVAVRLTGAVLGNVFVWSGHVFYPTYARGEAYWGVSRLADQNTAGAIMMVEGSILTLCLFCWLFLRAAREGEERQALLDLAAERGLELSDARAARAVHAGRGAELRRRLSGPTADLGGPDARLR